MKNADMPAMPQERELWVEGIGLCPTEATGLTKREIFAMHAMQGYLAMCAGAEKSPNDSEVAYEAVTIADALLAELEK